MALAEVVSLFAATNITIVPAYATATGSTCHDHPRRAARSNRNTVSAATPERKLATCQLVSAVALIAAPPVEKSSAAPRISRRLRVVATVLVAGVGVCRSEANEDASGCRATQPAAGGSASARRFVD